MTNYPKPGSIVRLLSIILGYLTLALFVTWPLVTKLATHFPDGTDTLVHYWNGWWSWYALSRGESPYHTMMLFYPYGVSMVYHNFAWIHILMWMILRPIVGNIAAYNLTFLLNLAFCGTAAFLLVHELIKNRAVAFLAGIIYQSWPHRLTQSSHPNLMSTWAIPLFLLFLTRAIKGHRWQDAVWAGLALALVGYTRWQLLIPAGLIATLYVLSLLPGSSILRLISLSLLTVVVAALVLAPPALLLVREWQTNPADLILEGEELTMQTDLLAYLTPAGSHPWFGRFTQEKYEHYYPDRGSRAQFSPYVGLSVLLLAVWGVAKSRFSATGPWLLIALVLIVMALGPTLRLNGQQYTSVPMPYSLASHTFVLRLFREPDRFNVFLALPMAVLAAFGIIDLQSRISMHKMVSSLLLGLVGAVILFEYLTGPLRLQTAQVSPFYTQLAAEPGEFAVLNIPVNPYKSKPYMFAQTIHQRPILQGHVSRYPQNAFRFLNEDPWLKAMQQFDLIPPQQTDIAHMMASLAAADVRFIIVHKELVGRQYWENWKTYLAIEPDYEDDSIAAYSTMPLVGQNVHLAAEIEPGLGIIRSISSANCLLPGHALEVDVAWGTAAPPKEDIDVRLDLVSEDGTVRHGQIFPIVHGPTTEWPANAVIWEYYVLQIPADLPFGDYLIWLSSSPSSANTSSAAGTLIGKLRISSEPCSYPLSPDVTYTNTSFGDTMRLLGYKIQQDDAGLTLGLYWRSELRTDTDYKVFVHVFDLATGIPVAQDDAMPRQWTYPTSYWRPGELVTDEISISLTDVPAGTYGVALGVYDSMTGERVPIADDSLSPIPDGRLVLDDVVTKR